MFDISKLDTFSRAEEGVDMEVANPKTGRPVVGEDGKPVTIRMLGRHSVTARAAQRRIQERASSRSNQGVIASADDRERDEIEYLASCTLGWSFTTRDDQPFPYSPENAKILWGDPRMRTVREQAFGFVHNDGNYLRD
jgi:hypothetical protein